VRSHAVHCHHMAVLTDEKEAVTGVTTSERGLALKEMPCPLDNCTTCKDGVGPTLADEFAVNRVEVTNRVLPLESFG
jgi:hypothetical protein